VPEFSTHRNFWEWACSYTTDCELFTLFTLLRHQYLAVAHIVTRLENLGFGPKSGFKNKCWARSVFRLQNEARLQLWCCDTKTLQSQCSSTW